MSVLESIRSPQDVKALTPDELPALAAEIRGFLIEAGSPKRRSSRAEPGCRGAHHRAAPGVRLPGRPDRVGHRPPVLCAQAADRPDAGLRPAAAARRGGRG